MNDITRPMRVLTVLLDVPVPPRSGFHLRQIAVLDLIRELGCESHALVFTTVDRPVVTPDVSDLYDDVRHAGPRIEYGSLRLAHRAWTRAQTGWSTLLQRPASAYPFAIPYDLANVGTVVGDGLVATKADAVVLPTTVLHLAPRIAAAGALVIGGAADVISQITRRVLRHSLRRPWKVPGLLVNHLATMAQERRFLGAWAEIWTSTEGKGPTLRWRLMATPSSPQRTALGAIPLSRRRFPKARTEFSLRANLWRFEERGLLAAPPRVPASGPPDRGHDVRGDVETSGLRVR